LINGAIKYEKGLAVRRVWTLEMIREEIGRLDELTGMHGLDVPCSMSERMSTVCGTFTAAPHDKPKTEQNMRFAFSAKDFTQFRGPGTEVMRLDGVRHEYAHYYAYAALGAVPGHNAAWREACRIVDCYPSTYWENNRCSYLECIEAHYPNCVPLNPENPLKDFRMSYEDALWAVRCHPIFGRDFRRHITAVEGPRDISPRIFGIASAPRVLLKVERLKNTASNPLDPASWIYEPRLDTRADTYEAAIIELAFRILQIFRW